MTVSSPSGLHDYSREETIIDTTLINSLLLKLLRTRSTNSEGCLQHTEDCKLALKLTHVFRLEKDLHRDDKKTQTSLCAWSHVRSCRTQLVR